MDSTLYFMHSSKQLLHFIKQEIISPAELFENINDWVQKNNHKIKYSSQVQGGKETLQQPSTPTSLQQQTGAQDFYGIVRWSILVKIWKPKHSRLSKIFSCSISPQFSLYLRARNYAVMSILLTFKVGLKRKLWFEYFLFCLR